MERITSASGNPINYVAQAFDARTNQLETQQKADTQQRDNDMLKVFEYAGDGRTEEAKFYAQQKQLEVPQEIFTNSDFAKGLALSGKFYGDDPAGAQKFTTAWVSNPNGDFLTRFNAAAQTAGLPKLKPSTLEQKIQFELWKQTQPKEPPISRYEAGVKAYNAAMQGAISQNPEAFETARQKAMTDWDNEFNPTYAQPAQPSNINSGDNTSIVSTPSGAQSWQAQPAVLPDISSGLVGGGQQSYTPPPQPQQTQQQAIDTITALDNARLAIAGGKDAQAVYDYLKQNGIDPTPIINR